MPQRTGTTMEELYQIPNPAQSMYNSQVKTSDYPQNEELKIQDEPPKNYLNAASHSTQPVNILLMTYPNYLETKTSNASAFKHPI